MYHATQHLLYLLCPFLSILTMHRTLPSSPSIIYSLPSTKISLTHAVIFQCIFKNVYLVFICFWHPWNFLSYKRTMMSFVMLITASGSHPRMRASYQENQPWNYRVGTFSPTPLTSKEGREDGDGIGTNKYMI